MTDLRLPLMLVLGALLTTASAATPVRVEHFTPSGSAKAVHSISARFSSPVVPFGEPRLADPFTHDCALAGSGRWLDSRNWAFEIEGPAPVGVRCTFKLRADLKAANGNAISGPQSFSFDTGGPSILQSEPWEGSVIEDQQVFLLGLDAPVEAAMLESKVHCRAEGVGEQIGVRVLAGVERAQVLDASPWFLKRYANARYPDSFEQTMVAQRPADEAAVRARYAALTDAADSSIVAVQCRQRLPAGRKVFVDWGPGLAAASGVANAGVQTLAFETRPDFTATLSCQRSRRDGGCLPGFDIRLDFSAPVARQSLQGVRLEGPDGQRFPVTLEGEASAPWAMGVTLRRPFPAHTTLTLHLPEKLVDDAGRTLANAASFPLAVRTEEDPPLAKFAAEFGIVEWHASPALPLTVRNIEPNLLVQRLPPAAPPSPGLGGFIEDLIARVLRRDDGWSSPNAVTTSVKGRLLRVSASDVAAVGQWFARVQQARRYDWFWNEQKQTRDLRGQPGTTEVLREASTAVDFELPRQTHAKAMEVLGIPLPKPGFYVAELSSPRLGAALFEKPAPYYAQAMALVTNLGVHLKWGRESSLVWVTALDSGKPVGGATVSVHDCAGKTLWQGQSNTQGIAVIADALPGVNQLPECPWNGHGLVAVAKLGEDVSLVASSWNNGISPWQFGLPGPSWFTAHAASSVLDRTLFKPGETVHMKHVLRTRTAQGFDVWQPAELQVRLRHDGSGTEIPLAATLDPATGNASGAWPIPESARQGVYRIQVMDGDGWLEAGEFRVESFRIPLLRADFQARELPLVNRDQLALDLQINYLAGGGASELPIKLRGLTQPRNVSFPDYENYSFANGDVTEGVSDDNEAVWSTPRYLQTQSPQPLPAQSLQLDRAGGAQLRLAGLPRSDLPQTLTAEVEYPDPNGEILTSSTKVPLWPSAVLLGLKPRDWAMSPGELAFTTVALDTRGRPLANVEVTVDLFQKIHYSSRKRLLGGFYAWDNRSEVKAAGPACRGRTNARGELSCTVATKLSGSLILRARATDAAGNPSVANRDVWVAARDEWWFAQGNDDRMELVPEQRDYAPGDTARLQVRMPYRQASALVTLEREGVLSGEVVQLSGKAPVVNVKLPANGAPNVFVSVLAVRGRDTGVQASALVDLGRPAFKLGMTELRVGWDAHRLKVKVTPEREQYQPGERAKLELSVQRANGEPLPANTEVAVAAVDEGLLELRPNASWQLLETMMRRRGIEVQTATAQMQVVGKRHFGRKAVAPGGGGGSGAGTRRMFDTLLLWQDRVKLDAAGRAHLEIPLNDALSSFRIVAIATGGTSLFGTGAATIRSTQTLMLHSGLPPLVRAGDRYAAGFTLRNAGERALSATVTASAKLTGPDSTTATTPADPLAPQTVTLAPGEARELRWDYAPPAAGTLQWEVHAKSDAKDVSDALSVTQAVIPALDISTVQASLLRVSGAQTLPVSAPAGALPGGELRVSLRPSLASTPAGVRGFFETYPFRCLEQRASQAIGLNDDDAWHALMAELPSYLDAKGLARYFPGDGVGSDTLSAYLLTAAAEAGREIPASSRMLMREGLVSVIEGRYAPRQALPTADLSLRKLAAIAALSHLPEDINPGWLDTLDLSPALWPTASVLDLVDILQRSPNLPKRAERLRLAQNELRNRLSPQGNQLTLASSPGDQLPGLMTSPDATLNRVLLVMAAQPTWAEDAPRLLTAALARQRAGHWDTTVANTWGVLALRQFAARFEHTPVAGRTKVSLGQRGFVQQWPATGHDESLPWPNGTASLSLQHTGGGAPWASLESRAAIPLTAPLASGYRVTRRVLPITQQTAGEWHRGDVYEVELQIEAKAEMVWVAISDPLPAGASVLGSGLGGDSAMLVGDAGRVGPSAAYTERRPEVWRRYFDYAPGGIWTQRYRVRLNNAGRFQLPPTRVDALYAPAVFGAVPNETLTVLP